MKKHINRQGLKILEYKKELLKNYSNIVQQALLISIEKMFELKQIDLQTLQMLKKDNVNEEKFLEFILNKTDFIRTAEQLEQELGVIATKLKSKLYMNNSNKNAYITTDVSRETISAFLVFSINEDFLRKNFNIQDSDIPDLIKRKGFLEKFAVLKLPHILKQLIKSIPYLTESSSQSKTTISSVYYCDKENTYSIDLAVEININDYYDDENVLEEMCEKIKLINSKLKNGSIEEYNHYTGK